MAELGNTPGGRRGYAGTWPPRGAAPVGGYVPSRPALWPPLVETFRQWVRAEAGAAIAAMAFCVTAFLLRRHKVFPVAVMVAALAAGFAVATWKAARISHG